MISMLLMSDIHFGSDKALPYIDDSVRFATFQKICMIARQHSIFIIAGDLFEGAIAHNPYYSSIKELLQSLVQEGVKIIYIPGEAELEDNSNIDIIHEIPSTVTLFGRSNNYYNLVLDKEIVYCYGGDSDIASITKASQEGFHVGIFHIDLEENTHNTVDSHVISVKLLKSMPLDFYALGHHHNFSMYKYKNKIIGAYPGSPEAVALAETGDRYVLSITVLNNEIHQIKRITVNTLRIESLTIQCNSIKSKDDLQNLLKPYNKPSIVLHCTLQGVRSFDTNHIMALCDRCAGVIFQDNSKISGEFICAMYKDEKTLKGYFFAELQKNFDNVSEDIMMDIINDIENTCSTYKGDL
ncbi:MAG: metallophosphoesterase [Spirochaetota bacterium]|nr:metallophosphoesterase [Spirochaetota bacterium]